MTGGLQGDAGSEVGLVISGYPLRWRQKGAGAYTARLIQGLLREAPDRRFRVLLPESCRELAEEFPEEIFEWLPGRAPLERALAQEIYWNAAIAWYALRRHPDAIFHSPGEMWSPVRPARTVVTLYDCIYRHFPRLGGGHVRRWRWRATERYARSASRVLTISQHSRADLVKYARIPAAKIRVVYPFVETLAGEGGVQDGAARRRYDLPADYLFYVGGYNCNKNVERLLAAYARAAQRRAFPPLVLAGGIPVCRPGMAVCDVHGAIAAAGLRPAQVRLIGAVPAADLAGLVAGARLLVYPSLSEGFGYPAAEAMAMGTPVIVSDSTSLPEVVREPRCRFDPTNVGAIADKLLEAEASPGDFRCALPPEFTAKVSMAAYLAVLDELPRP